MAGVLLVCQEMVGRLGAATGAGYTRLIYERFGSRWGAFGLSDLLIVDFLGSSNCRPSTMRPGGLALGTGSCRASHPVPGAHGGFLDSLIPSAHPKRCAPGLRSLRQAPLVSCYSVHSRVSDRRAGYGEL